MKRTLSKTLLATLIISGSISAFADSPWLVRVRGVGVLPEASSSTISVIGGKVTSISNTVVPELDFSYFLTPHVAAELILATSRHSPQATNTALGTVDLGKVWVLPPTLTLQYHLFPNQTINPYAGVGLNVTHFYSITNGPGLSQTQYTDSIGAALQLGVDIAINSKWSVNIDAKQIFMSSDVTLNKGTTAVATKVTINPVVVGVGVGYRFG
jgi:outer membrane protein